MSGVCCTSAAPSLLMVGVSRADPRDPGMTDYAVAGSREMLAPSVCMSDELALDARFTRLYEAPLPRVYSFVGSQVSTAGRRGDRQPDIFEGLPRRNERIRAMRISGYKTACWCNGAAAISTLRPSRTIATSGTS